MPPMTTQPTSRIKKLSSFPHRNSHKQSSAAKPSGDIKHNGNMTLPGYNINSKNTNQAYDERAVKGGSLFRGKFKRSGGSMGSRKGGGGSSDDLDASRRGEVVRKSSISNAQCSAPISGPSKSCSPESNLLSQSKHDCQSNMPVYKTTSLLAESLSLTNHKQNGTKSRPLAQDHAFASISSHTEQGKMPLHLNVLHDKAIKMAFTEIHNSSELGGVDSTSAYLGDESSIHNRKNFSSLFAAKTATGTATCRPVVAKESNYNDLSSQNNNEKNDALREFICHKETEVNLNNPEISETGDKPLSHASRSVSIAHPHASAPTLHTLKEDRVWNPSRVLVPVQGSDDAFLNYATRNESLGNSSISDVCNFVAPAILASCPDNVFGFYSKCLGTNFPMNSSLSSALSEARAVSEVDNDDTHISPFRSIVLGKAVVVPVSPSNISMDDSNSGSLSWATGFFVLRQNYLLEYEEGDQLDGRPKGYAHLEFATVSAHADFSNSLELSFCEKAKNLNQRRKLIMRLESQPKRDRWIYLLMKAAKLVIEDLYVTDKRLGRGRYATVMSATRRTYDNCLTGQVTKGSPARALKIIDKKMFWDRVRKGKERASTLIREVVVQATLTAELPRSQSRSTYLKIFGLFETSDTLVLELELLKGTDLFYHISARGVLHEREAAFIMRDILDCLSLMRRVGVAHRDLKPANILMCKSNETNGIAVKVGDFGMSTTVGVDNLVRGRCGTPGYVAPEILSAGPSTGYANKADLFSAGVTLYIMLCGYEPFYGESDAELVAANKVARVEFPESDWACVSNEAKELIVNLMEVNPDNRIEVNVALKHPWILKMLLQSNDHSNNLILSEGVQDEVACIVS